MFITEKIFERKLLGKQYISMFWTPLNLKYNNRNTFLSLTTEYVCKLNTLDHA